MVSSVAYACKIAGIDLDDSKYPCERPQDQRKPHQTHVILSSGRACKMLYSTLPLAATFKFYAAAVIDVKDSLYQSILTVLGDKDRFLRYKRNDRVYVQFIPGLVFIRFKNDRICISHNYTHKG